VDTRLTESSDDKDDAPTPPIEGSRLNIPSVTGVRPGLVATEIEVALAAAFAGPASIETAESG
jgi:hypothetical protein